MKPQATDAGRLTRRRFLSAGLLAGSLALGGGLLFWPRSVPPGVDGEARRWHFLSPANAQAVIALAPALLGPTASADGRQLPPKLQVPPMPHMAQSCSWPLFGSSSSPMSP